MSNQPQGQEPHRYQPADQFLQNPAPDESSQAAAHQLTPEPVQTQHTNYNPQPFEPVQPTQTVATPVSPPPVYQPSQPPLPPSPSAFNSEAMMAVPKPLPEEIVVEWEAMSRPHKKRNRQYYTTVAAIVILLSLILFFAGQLLPIAVVIAFAFLVYVLEMVPPSIVRHAITTYGLRIEGNLYYWDEIGRFWFTQRHNLPVLHFEIARFPNRLTILIGDLPEPELTELLSEMLVNEQPAPTYFEKAAAWLERTIPLDTDDKPQATAASVPPIPEPAPPTT